MTETSPAELLDLPLPANESGETSVRGYLAALAGIAWSSGDNIHPWGNSGWQYDLYKPLLDAGCAGGLTGAEAERLRQQYGIPEAKREELDRLVLDLIASLRTTPATAPPRVTAVLDVNGTVGLVTLPGDRWAAPVIPGDLVVALGERETARFKAGRWLGVALSDPVTDAALLALIEDDEPEGDGKGCRCYQPPKAHVHVSDEDGDCLTCGCGQYKAPAEDSLPGNSCCLLARRRGDLIRDILQALPDTADEAQWRDQAGRLDVCDPDGQPYAAARDEDDFDEDEQRAADLRAHVSGMGGPSPAYVTDDAAGLSDAPDRGAAENAL